MDYGKAKDRVNDFDDYGSDDEELPVPSTGAGGVTVGSSSSSSSSAPPPQLT